MYCNDVICVTPLFPFYLSILVMKKVKVIKWSKKYFQCHFYSPHIVLRCSALFPDCLQPIKCQRHHRSTNNVISWTEELRSTMWVAATKQIHHVLPFCSTPKVRHIENSDLEKLNLTLKLGRVQLTPVLLQSPQSAEECLACVSPPAVWYIQNVLNAHDTNVRLTAAAAKQQQQLNSWKLY